MGVRYGVPIHVRSTFSDNEGTIIREDYTMEENKRTVIGVADDTNVAKVSLIGVENKPGVAHTIFQSLADKNVDVDMIVQSIRTVEDQVTDIVFTITRDDVVLARDVIEELKKHLQMEDYSINENMAKVSIVGAGMLGQPGIAAQMFGIFSQEDINIEIISTSEISVACLIDEARVKDAIRAIHDNLVVNNRG